MDITYNICKKCWQDIIKCKIEFYVNILKVKWESVCRMGKDYITE